MEQQEAIAVAEEKQTTAQVTPESEPKLSKEFAALLKKESEFRKKEAEYKKQLEEKDSVLSRYREIEEKGKEDPEFLLQAVGWDHDKINSFRNKAAQVSPEIIELRKEMQALREEREREIAERQKSEHQKTVQEKESKFKSEIFSYIDSNEEEYELINKLDKKNEVYSLIVDYWKSNKKVLTPTQAAKEVEERLKSEYEPLLNTLKNSKKFANIFISEGLSGKTVGKEVKKEQILTKPKVQTLTAKDTGSPVSKPADDLPTDPEARFRELINRYKIAKKG